MRSHALMLAAFVAVPLATAQAAPPDMQKLVTELQQLDIGVSNVQSVERKPNSPVPNSYESHIQFEIASVAPRGGQMFACAQARYCDAIYEYFYALRGLAGPYIYRSGDGLIVAQLNSGLSVKEAEAVETVLLEVK